MSTEQNKTVLRRWMEAFNVGNVSFLNSMADELYTADYVLHDPGVADLPPGPAGVKEFVRGVFRSWPDVHITIDDLVAEGDRVAMRFRVCGTDASTRQPKTVLVMSISRFTGGKIAEEWELGVPAAEAHDPVAVVKALDAACNAGDIEGVMALFAEDAVLKEPVESKILTGKEQIRAWFEPQLGHFQVASTNHSVSGETVTWEATLTGEIPKTMGMERIDETAKAVVKGGKITSFELTIVEHKP